MNQGIGLNKEAETYSVVRVLFVLFSSNLSQMPPFKTPFPLNKTNFPHGYFCWDCCLKSHKINIVCVRFHLPKLMGNGGSWWRGKMEILCSGYLSLTKAQQLFLEKPQCTFGTGWIHGTDRSASQQCILAYMQVNWDIKGANTHVLKGISTFFNPRCSPAILLLLWVNRIKTHFWYKWVFLVYWARKHLRSGKRIPLLASLCWI